MVLDRETALHGFARELCEFAAGARLEGAFAAETNGSPEPYAEFLPGLREQRAAVDYSDCHLAKDR
jgi:hypothetical protein